MGQARRLPSMSVHAGSSLMCIRDSYPISCSTPYLLVLPSIHLPRCEREHYTAVQMNFLTKLNLTLLYFII